MRGEKEPASERPDDADESFDGVRVEPITPSQRHNPGANVRVLAPEWTKRISTRGKLTRGLMVALALFVALIVVLPRTSFTLPPAVSRLLTPAPTQTPKPGRFTAGEFEQIPIPAVPGAVTNAVVPSPRDPSTAFTCMFPVQTDRTAGVTSGEISLWITHDAGQTWSRAELPAVIGTSCNVETTVDGSNRVAFSVSNLALDRNAQACAHSGFYLSEDDGAHWRSIQHTTVAPAVSQYGDCFLWVTARRLYLHTFMNNNGSSGRSILERSDDGGQTWLRADHGLEDAGTQWFAQPLDSDGDSLITLISKYDITNQLQSDLWITHDAGASWRRVGPAAPTTPQPNFGIGFLLTEAARGDESQLCHCVFGASNTPSGSFIAGQHVYRTTDFIHWTPLPPVPVKGTSVQRSGVYEVLETTANGKLVAVGADPVTGVLALPDHNGLVSGPPPALWAWDTHTGRWEVAQTSIPCADLQTCFIYSIGVSFGDGASGKPPATYVWISVQAASGENGPPVQTYYRLFIAAS